MSITKPWVIIATFVATVMLCGSIGLPSFVAVVFGFAYAGVVGAILYL